MASSLKNLSEYNAEKIIPIPTKRIGIVISEYHGNITKLLSDGAIETLKQHGVLPRHISILYVPGAYELVAGTEKLARLQPNLDAIITIGCVIKGDTDHDKYINHAVAQGLVTLNIKYEKPIVFGLLTPNTLEQAQDRAGGKHGNKGVEVAIAAIKMLTEEIGTLED